MNPEEQSQYRSSQFLDAYKRRELERETLKLERRYHYDAEELEHWMKVFGEAKLIEVEPESNEDF